MALFLFSGNGLSVAVMNGCGARVTFYRRRVRAELALLTIEDH